MFRESVRKWFQDNVPRDLEEKWEKQGHVDRDAWLKAGEMGLLGVDAPEEVGGIGGDFLSAMIVNEEQAYHNCSGLGFSVHSDICLPYIYKYGTAEQRELIPSFVSGEKILCIGMTEPGTGSDLQGLKTTAIADGDDYVINGSKVFISNGFNRGKNLKKVGVKANDTAELFFDNLRVPKSAVLGGPDCVNQGFGFLMNELARERLMIGVQCTAGLESMFEQTRAYVKERKAFGKELIKLQTIQHRLAEVKTEAAFCRSFVDKAMELQVNEELDYTTASMAKYMCSEKAHVNISKMLQLFGGWGYMWEYPIARAYADSRVAMVYGGANEIMKELIARPIRS
ncbi:Oidioi.mRNA.OKI2018_I69.chr1.g140.t2.cds [Oikopleura dioica]|uniref:short-chain acyl-CoA dehydrogenase n=2 Tax=Oikopleura dioica TaxID=34765 RepID=A0ABN7SMN7_OIKDI|nr:Oidioi.mRNA.OKI2018_I69.chr1.g140.t2.cds [Oikopleura dioica]